ncbi:hypothetical protein NE172_06350 [Clostridium botulinum]|uniref:Uncharacterized protein n=1 Tax=Clostridium botulinum TaxID=1491 RepID=A0A6B4JKS0_CLOBO|nr:hypothetical protein [Clostridium botulinum]EES49689.1 conserved hypothetical protein [Clostridium botulinum E1 str. 'BoNT E Beluga']MBY6760783.1 hypothetical protein [Clostridium botulinum]MBY6919925.1 hypothetical protein [Clostridium botulinum]MCR1130569.1 hypothetical protein [Clostridium botulinum]NFJ57472.1 hypothetical protein [Clostridium botulinum]
MANSRRVYITLNSDKDKDRIIEELLSSAYSESDFIKETLYRLATQGDNLELINNNSIVSVQKVLSSDKKVKKNTKSKSNNKVQKGVENNDKSLKDDNSSVINMEQIETINTETVQIDNNSDNEELMNNLSSELDRYF